MTKTQDRSADTIDQGLLQFATVRQVEYLDAIQEHGGIRAAARALGVDNSTITKSMQGLKSRAAIQGYSPEHQMVHPVPATHIAKGVSTLYKSDGTVGAQWVKSSLDMDKYLQVVREVVADMISGLPPVDATPPPIFTHDSLLNLYTLTDSHVGMRAWHKEGGADWDLAIAERVLTGCFQHMVDASPAASVAVVNQLGDWLHQDGVLPVTPTSGHLLDADGRFSKVVQAAVRIIRRVVSMALAKHDKVILLIAEGNHDISSSIWLRALFMALYENEPRVEVLDSDLPYYVYQHGDTMLCFHHGHLKKNDQLPILFASQFPKIWGNTTKRYAHTGHRHHVEEKEHSGLTVMQHSTLAARDAYAARGGWMSERQVTSITYHSMWGQVARNTITPEMLEADVPPSQKILPRR